ncbi:MAG: alcohol dehydrogenase catalytic domain-containing protein [Firmicutes bacterium]|nr:alcohol dehydrogenase catalytic domain-containing protein [Bacillota bacterium]
MIAASVPEPGRWRVGEHPDAPPPAAGEARVRVIATTVCATDRKVLEGRFAGVRYPLIPGHEWGGEVVAVGDGVTHVRPGDRVGVEVHVGCGACERCREGMRNLCLNYGRRESGHAHIGFTRDGGLAQFATVPARALYPVPENVPDDALAFVDSLALALAAAERGGVRAGARVAVFGSGAIGLLAAQAARAMGARVAVVAGGRESRRRLAEALGFPTALAADERLRERLVSLLGGDPDVALEMAGGEQAATQAILSVRRGGAVVLAGSTGTGPQVRGVELATVVRGQLSILGSVATHGAVVHRAVALLAAGAVDTAPLVSHRLGLSRFEEAWDIFCAPGTDAVRVLLDPAA